jgi:hypothetical protein
MTGMALIDATARFEARREEARKTNGRFGEQEHSAPELTLVTEPPQTLEEIFEELNELGELDDDLSAPPIDTYSGTPEEREALARQRELGDLLRRAGIDRDALSEKTLGDIQNGLAREAANRASAAAYQARQPLPVEDVQTTGDVEIDAAVDAIIEARGYDRAEYDNDSREYTAQWAREERAAGRLQESLASEVAASRHEREAREDRDETEQFERLGDDIDAAWDEALVEDRLRAQQTIRRLRPTNYVPLKETNALIRGNLKDEFGAVKFSVRGNSYSGGASTDISYVDGPPQDRVEEVARSFAGASFDGMTDLKSYHSVSDFDAHGIPVSTHYAADFVFTRREFSDDVTRDATAFLIQAFAAEGKAFDPNERNTPHEIPQALYNRASEENGGQRAGGYGFTFRGNEHYGNELVSIASTLIANERWAARQK